MMGSNNKERGGLMGGNPIADMVTALLSNGEPAPGPSEDITELAGQVMAALKSEDRVAFGAALERFCCKCYQAMESQDEMFGEMED